MSDGGVTDSGRQAETKRAKAGRRREDQKNGKGHQEPERAERAERRGLLGPSSISDALAEETKTESKRKALAAPADC